MFKYYFNVIRLKLVSQYVVYMLLIDGPILGQYFFIIISVCAGKVFLYLLNVLMCIYACFFLSPISGGLFGDVSVVYSIRSAIPSSLDRYSSPTTGVSPPNSVKILE